MRQIDERDDVLDLAKFYLPHHSVEKETSTTTKLRVVFDASCKSSTGLSLNDVLPVGPVVQQDLLSIILRFRTHVYVLAADVTKMYRQILVHESQTPLQRIFWRNDPAEPIGVYELTTVSYGTASTSFLATRCLQYLASESEHEYPVGSRVVSRDFYVDDMLTGADSIADLRVIRDEVTAILSGGRFVLSKWASNSTDILDSVQHQRDDQPQITFDKDDAHRILGIRWRAINDEYYFYIKNSANIQRVTKRTILSEISQLFDPLGLLSPVIVTAKVLIQKLWSLNLDWDESVTCDVHTQWVQFKDQLVHVNNLRIPRRVKFNTNANDVELHGFCDASEIAFGACIYVRSRVSIHEYRIELLCSKSRVTPLRAVTIARLELCAAHLLAELFQKVQFAIGSDKIRNYFWSDSTIVLNWIASAAGRWDTFVANRVGEIQRLTNISDWRHVRTLDNPADIVSRGLIPEHLVSSDLWWHGPRWLCEVETHWPDSTTPSLEGDMPEEKRVGRIAQINGCSPIEQLLDKFSSLNKIARVTAYLFRFSRNAGKVRRNEPDCMTRDKLDSSVTHAAANTNSHLLMRCRTPSLRCADTCKIGSFRRRYMIFV